MQECINCIHEKCCMFQSEKDVIFANAPCHYFDDEADFIRVRRPRTKKLTHFNKIKNCISAHQMAELIYNLDWCKACEYSRGEISCHAPSEKVAECCKKAMENLLIEEDKPCEDGKL